MSQDSTISWQRCLQHLSTANSMISGQRVSEAPALTVAIPFDHSGRWAAQTSFLRSVAASLQRTKHTKARLLILNQSGSAGAKAVTTEVRDLLVSVEREVWHSFDQRKALLNDLGIDCVLNLFGAPPIIGNTGLVCWLPDFQHFRFPEFFSAQENAERDRLFHEAILRSDRVLLSSRDAERDCLRFDPDAEGKTRVHPFPSGFAFENMPPLNVHSVLNKYHLPDKFVLVANQFWAHKNHLTVVAAAKRLAECGQSIPFVLTGLPSDYRDPSNSIVSKLLQAISTHGLRQTLIPLAQVPYHDLIGLLRHSALIIQPSSFEGWSTTVQDAKALGRPVACSAISVHREQAPNAVGYFHPTQGDELAELLCRIWPGLSPGPDLKAEAIALINEQHFANDYGLTLWHTCAEASDAARQREQHIP